ncbi:hypothetical protein PsYK624_130700 [Phanerochaete sordida]|uniref:Uncharacterized protein n=1 Tax=Phanerochaete sordida TaxID=48140 RepID=A0A9P3GL08_9APHY|nr:hypothetical protein PsYK624_130700 [Phanerochaete sordida]
MDDTDSSVTERIRQEKDSWGEFQQTMLRDGVLPCLNEVAGVMAEVNKSIMTPSESQDNAVLEAFLRSSAALRSMLDGTEIRIRDALAAYRESVQDRTELKNMMRTSQELQHRAHELLRTIKQVQKRARGLRTRKITRLLNFLGITPRMDEDRVVSEVAARIKVAQASFKTRMSVDIGECIDSVTKTKEKQVQFRLAEIVRNSSKT